MKLYDIPAHLPFLDCLAAGVLSQAERTGPESLSRATILLPTRRSARALRDAFLRAAGAGGPLAAEGRALLLPRMRALAGLSTEDADELALPTLLDLPPAVEALTRRAVLARCVMRLPPRHGGPSSPEHAWDLAGALATLLDEIALEERDLSLLDAADPDRFAAAWLERLEALVPEDQARHWQITTAFLRGIVAAWNGWLAEEGLLDIGVRRVLALRAQTEAWRADPPEHAVIAAGIGVGGTIPAAAELLSVVANLPHGAVVLHGLDRRALARVWDAVGRAPTHPLCSQARLLVAMGAEQDRVRRWPAALTYEGSVPEARPRLLEIALRPPEGMAEWTEPAPLVWGAATGGLTRLRAADAQAEAAAIALTLREALERPGARAAVVTPDRDLARRVSAELARHGIVADDSAGEPLAQTPAGAFLRLVARMVAEDFAPVPTLACLKHPLCAAGMERGAWLSAVRLLERRALRGPRPAGGLDGLRRAAAAALKRDDGLARAGAVLDALARALDGFDHLPEAPARPPADLLRAHLAAAEALAATEAEAGTLRLYAGEEGEALASHLAAMGPAMEQLPPLSPARWPAIFDAAMADVATRSVRAMRGREGAPHPRVEILGLLEARLLSFDRVVLGALDESVWPLATDPGPWMSRPMRAGFGLPEPEARIGRVCMDFFLSACSAPEAVLSRAARRGGSPTVPARWLTRLQTFLDGQGGLRLEESAAPRWAAALDMPAIVTPCPRPAPAPPAAVRPREIRVTEVATLIADPYAFYARRVLGLAPLDPLDAEVGAAEYGQIVHGALRRFVDVLSAAPGWPGDAAAEAAWAAAAEQALEGAGPRPGVAAFWRPRLARIGRFAIEVERAARSAHRIARSLTERRGELRLPRDGGDITLIARADRLDILADGTVAVIDYKTGAVPAREALEDGRAPQLPLEAAMVHLGAFRDLPGAPVSEATYWRVSGGQQAGEVKPMLRDAPSVGEAAESALDRLGLLVDRLLLGTAPFHARPHPARSTYGEYDHLSRLAEWAGAEDAEAGG